MTNNKVLGLLYDKSCGPDVATQSAQRDRWFVLKGCGFFILQFNVLRVKDERKIDDSDL